MVFAPTPLPPETSPLPYTHPSGAFSAALPRAWPVYEQNTPTLASASFVPPGESEPLVTFAVMKLPAEVDSSAFADLINRYQSQVRPDVARYTEQDRQAMGDGSWRLTGLRAIMGGGTQQVNTFIEHSGALVGVIDAVLSTDSGRFAELQTAINTFRINPSAALDASDLTALSGVFHTSLEIVNLATWTTPAGVFFITGEVANNGVSPVSGVPVRAALWTADGLAVAEAVDTVMGYTILPGGFAPFSLRFGQGQPAFTTTYTLTLGSDTWQPGESIAVSGSDQLTWTDATSYTQQGQLVVSGTVSNTGDSPVDSLRVTVTIFNAERRVIAAAFTDLPPEPLAPGGSLPYQLIIPDIGGTPADYIVNIQGLP